MTHLIVNKIKTFCQVKLRVNIRYIRGTLLEVTILNSKIMREMIKMTFFTFLL